MWGLGRRSSAPHASVSKVRALIIAQDARALDDSDKRSAFMVELRKATGGTASPILEALADGEGVPLARSLALLVAGETASASDIASICRIHNAAKTHTEKLAAVMALLTKRGEDPFSKAHKVAMQHPEIPGLSVKMGAVPSTEAAKCVLACLAEERKITWHAPLVWALTEAQEGMPEITDLIIQELLSSRGKGSIEFYLVSALSKAKSDKAVAVLRDYASKEPEALALLAVSALVEQDTDTSVKDALDILRQKDIASQALLFQCLASSKNLVHATAIDEVLVNALQNGPKPKIRSAAAAALSARTSSSVRSALEAALQKESDAKVKAEIEKALGLLKKLQQGKS